ncbi:MAG: serine/threonine-protein kinase, partial [Kofleriaceae bacterium]
MTEQCPDIDALAAFATGDVGSNRTALVAHLDRCVDCRRVVAAAAADDEGGDESSSRDSTRTGPRIGRFVIQRVLGEGAMGIVHLAYDPELKRNVALKVIKPESGDLLAAERLTIEAQTAAQLSHKNAVTIYDVGVHDHQPYVAMEYVEGTTVAEWLKTGVAWREALQVMLSAGEGLAAAHRAGLVHRDFKPANILLGNDGSVKVSDFGLARFADERKTSIAAHEEALEIPRSTRATTSTGVLVGTPAYTSPEQFSGAVATPASDQFAFGVALYRALYGVRPFRGPTLYAVYEAIVNEPAPPPPRDARVPLALWPIVER